MQLISKIRKSKIFLLVSLLISLFISINSYSQSNPAKPFVATETYVELFPRDGYLHIIEYDLRPVATDKNEIAKAIADVKSKISTASYSKAAFGFSTFVPVEERIYKDKRGIIIGEYNLVSKYEQDLPLTLQDSLAKILNRPIEPQLSQKKYRHNI